MRPVFRAGATPDEHGLRLRGVKGLPNSYAVDLEASRGLGGRAPKVFLTAPGRPSYIAKGPTRPHVGPRECVTEHLIARLGNLLPVRFANTRLARLALPEAEGLHFLSEYFLIPKREQLLHGVEAFALALGTNREAMRRDIHQLGRTAEQDFYSLSMVQEVLLEVARPRESGDALVAAFARMVTFDALLGIGDRHAMNWGLIHDTETRERRFAPLFDSARGLFLRIPEKVLRANHQKDAFLMKYARKASPLIGYDGCEGTCNHFELFEAMLGAYSPSVLHSSLALVDAATDDRVRTLLRREFDSLVSPVRLEMICKLVSYRRCRLQEIAASTI